MEKGSSSKDACVCVPGFVLVGVASCSKCGSGKYKPNIGNENCLDCARGKFSSTLNATNKDVCQSCPLNSTTDINNSKITDCKCESGFHGPNGENCVKCEAGKYKPVIGSITCTDCMRGKYSTTIGQVAEKTCIQCPLNSDSVLGTNELRNCNCNEGFRKNKKDICLSITQIPTNILFRNLVSFESDFDIESIDITLKQVVKNAFVFEIDIDVSRIYFITAPESKTINKRRLLQIYPTQFMILSSSKIENNKMNMRIIFALTQETISRILRDILGRNVIISNLKVSKIDLSKEEPILSPESLDIATISGITGAALIFVIILCFCCKKKDRTLNSVDFNTSRQEYCEICSYQIKDY